MCKTGKTDSEAVEIQMEGQTLGKFMIFCVLICNIGSFHCNATQNDRVVNIGVVLNNNSWVGKVAKTAIEISGEDVNRDTQLLNGSHLFLHFRDSGGDPVVGASAGKLHLFCFYSLPYMKTHYKFAEEINLRYLYFFLFSISVSPSWLRV